MLQEQCEPNYIAVEGVIGVGKTTFSNMLAESLEAELINEEVFENPREYTLELEVSPRSPLAGSSIEKSGLRHLPGAFLAELIREDGQIVSAVSPSEILLEGPAGFCG